MQLIKLSVSTHAHIYMLIIATHFWSNFTEEKHSQRFVLINATKIVGKVKRNLKHSVIGEKKLKYSAYLFPTPKDPQERVFLHASLGERLKSVLVTSQILQPTKGNKSIGSPASSVLMLTPLFFYTCTLRFFCLPNLIFSFLLCI